MTIRMSLMPYLASALFLKWEDQTTGSSFLACNTKLGFAASALSENLPLFCREEYTVDFPAGDFPVGFAPLCKFNAGNAAGTKSALHSFRYICTLTAGRA